VAAMELPPNHCTTNFGERSKKNNFDDFNALTLTFLFINVRISENFMFICKKNNKNQK